MFWREVLSHMPLFTQELKHAKLPVLLKALYSFLIMRYAARIIHYIFLSYGFSSDPLRTACTKTDKRLHECYL